MRRQFVPVRVLHMLVLLSMFASFTPPSAHAALQTTSIKAPSDAAQWPAPVSPDFDTRSPFLDPRSQAIASALGTNVPDTVMSSEMLEPLPDVAHTSFPSDIVPQTHVPNVPNPLALIGGLSAPPANLASLADRTTTTPEPTASTTADPTATPATSSISQPTTIPSISPAAQVLLAPSESVPSSPQVSQVPFGPLPAPVATVSSSSTLFLPLVSSPASGPDVFVVNATESRTFRSRDGMVELVVPAGAVSGITTLLYQPLAAQSTNGYKPVGIFFELTASDAQGNPITHFQRELTLRVRYSEQPELDETKLKLYFSNAANPNWTALPSSVDAATNTLVATSDHFTTFAVLAAPTPPCSYAVGSGNAVPLNVTQAFSDTFQLFAPGCPTSDTHFWPGTKVYTQDFPDASIIYNATQSKAYYLNGPIIRALVDQVSSGPGGWIGLPISNIDPAGPIAEFKDKNYNFVGQPIAYFEHGFIGFSNGVAEAHRPFPRVNAEVVIRPVQKGTTYEAQVDFNFSYNLFGGNGANNQLTARYAGKEETIKASSGTTSWNTSLPDTVALGQTVQFWSETTRSLGPVPYPDTLSGYAPCDRILKNNLYTITVPVITDTVTTLSFPYTCLASDDDGGISLPPPDTTPPTIHYMDLFQSGAGAVAVRARVTDNRAVASVELLFNGKPYPMVAKGNDIYEVAIPNGPRTGNNRYRIHAVDTSGNEAYFRKSGEIVVPASQARNFGSSIFKDGCPCGFTGSEGDPVNTQNGNFTYETTDVTVAGVGETELTIRRAYNSLAAFGSGGGTTRFTEEGDQLKTTVIAGPPQLFGRGWTFPYAVRLLIIDNLLMQGAQVFYPDGRVVNFERAGNGFKPTTPFNFDQLVATGSGYELRHKRTLEVEVFDADGRLVARKDRNGNTVRLSYTGDRLVRVENASGRWLTFDYNSDGTIAAINAPENKRITYGYTDGDLTSVTDARGNITRYSYTSQHQLTQITTPESHPSLRLSYDDQHRVTEQIIGATERHGFSYSSDGTLTTLSDSYGNKTLHVYDDQGRLIEVRDALNRSEFYRYNDQFNRIYFKDHLGREYHYTFDAHGNKLTEDGPLGWHREWDYNALDQVTRSQDAEGRVTVFVYDTRGNLTGITNAAQGTSSITYDPRGLPTEVRDFNDNPTVNTYDPITGDLTKTRNGAGDETSFTYDALGRLRSTTNGRGFTTTFTYDGNDNLTQVDSPLGFRLRYGYDKNNNRTTATDANSGVTTFVYDTSEWLVEQRNPLDESVFYSYDDMGHLTRVEDAEHRVWTFDYDAVYQRIAEHGPEDTHTLYVYDLAGNITDVARCVSTFVADDCVKKQVHHLVYDDLNRVITEVANYLPSVAASADTNVTTVYTYDKVGNLRTRTDANNNTTQYEYDQLDRLVRQEDAAKQVTTYSYDGMGNLRTVTNPRTFTTIFTYDPANRLASSTDALTQITRYVYDHNGNLVAMIDPQDIVTRYDYDALDRLTTLIQNERSGESTTSTRNVTTRFGYDTHGNLRFVYDPRGTYVTEHQYDAANRRVLTIDAEGGRTAYAYDHVGNLTAVTDPNLHVTTTTYDGLNRRVRVTNPEGHHVDFSYDRLGNLQTLTDARGNRSTYVYDGVNRVVRFTDAANGMWGYVYDAMGNLLTETDANDHVATSTYDVVYRLLNHTDAEGNVSAWTYDPNGNPVTFTDGNNHVTRSAYDALDRLATLTNAENETTAYTYDWQGHQIAMTEADGVVTAYTYDPLYRLSAVTMNNRSGQPESADVNVSTRYEYDAAGNLIRITDGNGNPTSFSFDGMNRLVREVDALSNTWEYAYDKAGNRTARIDALRHRTAYSYYPDNQPKRTDYFDGTFVENTFDENNNSLTVANQLGVTRRSYDALNRVSEETDAFNRRSTFSYDAVGNRLTIRYPDGRVVTSSYARNNWLQATTDPDGRVTSYTRDGVGNVVRQDNPNNTVVTSSYDKANRLLSVETRQVGGAGTVNSRFEYTYDRVGQRLSMTATYAWRQPGVETSTYSYDPLRRLVRDESSGGRWTKYTFDRVGNRLTLATNDDSQSARPFDAKTQVYSYNAINQLLTVVSDTRPASNGLNRADNAAQPIHAFRHEVAAQQSKGIAAAAATDLLARADALLADLYGNPTPKVAAVSDAVATLRGQVQTYQTQGAFRNSGIATSLLAKLKLGDDANTGAGGELQTTTYSYDANGNRVNKEFPGPQGPRVQGSDYTYDPENMLVIAQDYQGNAQGNRVNRAVTVMDHDGEGRRLLKGYDPKDGGGGTQRVEYVYDGLLPIAEYNTRNGQHDNFYRGDMGRMLELHHFPSGTAGQVYWYHYDGLGSVAGLTKQSGQSSHNYRYEAYGQIEAPNGNFSDPHNHYTFTGQEWDEHTGLYDFYARQYDPEAGVWMGQDPYRGQLVEPRSLHRYGYVEGDPVNNVDLFGFKKVVFVQGITSPLGGGSDVSTQWWLEEPYKQARNQGYNQTDLVIFCYGGQYPNCNGSPNTTDAATAAAKLWNMIQELDDDDVTIVSHSKGSNVVEFMLTHYGKGVKNGYTCDRKSYIRRWDSYNGATGVLQSVGGRPTLGTRLSFLNAKQLGIEVNDYRTMSDLTGSPLGFSFSLVPGLNFQDYPGQYIAARAECIPGSNCHVRLPPLFGIPAVTAHNIGEPYSVIKAGSDTYNGATWAASTAYNGATWAASTAYNGATWAASTAYNGAIRAAGTAYNGAIRAASTPYNGAIRAAGTAYNITTWATGTPYNNVAIWAAGTAWNKFTSLSSRSLGGNGGGSW